MRAFADDMGCLLADLTHSLPLVASAFALLGLAACLQVHPAKTQLCMLLNVEGLDIDACLANLGRGWQSVKRVEFIKYLGVLVGPGAHLSQWDETLGKFNAAAASLAGLGYAPPSALR